ncbi:protein IQ-DOMAIN 1 isoform X2 [Vigna radiata var. radiata]|uniref:Protein IQ-DOMAIN 1 isoform X2 n=1 Tax=Vigna radiata var. radiata TaxID=3916 RepID=A0A1S3TJZ6_VIGRR|nr:protein IQ-DOMAIN 1 isoform X2 [Vigna radiata var. radiata]
MGPKKWFKRIVKLKKRKEDKLEQAKVQFTPEKLDESWEEKQDETLEESNSISNEGLVVVERTVPTRLMEDIAATRIQNAFRAFLARRTLHNLRDTALNYTINIAPWKVELKVEAAKEQAVTALNYIHTWSRIQEQIKARRLYMLTEARIKQKKLENQLKLAAEIHQLQVGWCGGSDTMEEILFRIHQREEAAVKRERAMAYAFSHQWRPNCRQYLGQAIYSVGKESWGWSWKERWVAARPWQIRVRFPDPITKKTTDSKVPLSNSELSNTKETPKGKENNIPDLSNNNLAK